MRASSQSSKMHFSLLRVPFFLEPDYPRSEEFEETNRVRLHRKWGSEAGFEAQKKRHRLKERGHEVGIKHFDLDRIASSTFAAHRLIQYVTKQRGGSAAESLYADLNERHFEGGQKLNCQTMLIDAARRVGIGAEEARSFLDGDEGNEEIEQAQTLLRRMGINSIPTVCIGGKYVVNGAVGHQQLVDVFRQVEAMPEAECVGWFFADALRIPRMVLEEPIDLSVSDGRLPMEA